jgi:hypothetical protein
MSTGPQPTQPSSSPPLIGRFARPAATLAQRPEACRNSESCPECHPCQQLPILCSQSFAPNPLLQLVRPSALHLDRFMLHVFTYVNDHQLLRNDDFHLIVTAVIFDKSPPRFLHHPEQTSHQPPNLVKAWQRGIKASGTSKHNHIHIHIHTAVACS